LNFHRLAIGSGLWETWGMKKPHLVRNLRPDNQIGTMVAGACSSCPKAVFQADSDKALEEKFSAHFREVHMKEDASQAAARIVREATKS